MRVRLNFDTVRSDVDIVRFAQVDDVFVDVDARDDRADFDVDGVFDGQRQVFVAVHLQVSDQHSKRHLVT